MSTDTTRRDPRDTREYAARLRSWCAGSPHAAGWSNGEVDATLADIGTRLGVGVDLAQSVCTKIATKYHPPRLIAYVRAIPALSLRDYLPPPKPAKRPLYGTPRQATRDAPDCEHGWPNGTARTRADQPLCPLCRRQGDLAVTA